MNGRIRPIIACLLACAFGAAAAVENEDFNFDTTEDLYQICATEQDQPEYTVSSFACRAFIEATVQYHDAVADRKKMKAFVCPPDTATIAQGRSAFVSWAKSNAGDAKLMGEMPVVGVVRALATRFPCR